jgi:hypothetical protein
MIILLILLCFLNPSRASTLTDVCASLDVSKLPQLGWTPTNGHVLYSACCGLGHRLGRNTHAFVNSLRNLETLSIDWGHCGDSGPIFDHLFERSQESNMTLFSSPSPYKRVISNEEHGLHAWLNSEECASDPRSAMLVCSAFNRMKPAIKEKYQLSMEILHDQPPFHHSRRSIVGVHVRHGNGETGDFTGKGRDRFDLRQLLHDTLSTIAAVVRQNQLTPDYAIFLATDSVEVEHMMRNMTLHPVLVRSQNRAPPGTGVTFGAWGHMCTSGKANPACQNMKCLDAFSDIWLDLMVLSSCDAIVSSRYSSFVQSAQTLARARNIPFCNVGSGESCGCICNPRVVAHQRAYCMHSRRRLRSDDGSLERDAGETLRHMECIDGGGSPFAWSRMERSGLENGWWKTPSKHEKRLS